VGWGKDGDDFHACGSVEAFSDRHAIDWLKMSSV